MRTSSGTPAFHQARSRVRSTGYSNDWRLPRDNAKFEEREKKRLLPKRKSGKNSSSIWGFPQVLRLEAEIRLIFCIALRELCYQSSTLKDP